MLLRMQMEVIFIFSQPREQMKIWCNIQIIVYLLLKFFLASSSLLTGRERTLEIGIIYNSFVLPKLTMRQELIFKKMQKNLFIVHCHIPVSMLGSVCQMFEDLNSNHFAFLVLQLLCNFLLKLFSVCLSALLFYYFYWGEEGYFRLRIMSSRFRNPPKIPLSYKNRLKK